MPNIILTYKCNLNCPYCFANEFVNKENDEITIENFHKAVNFIINSGLKTVGLIGGEPLTHKNIKYILNSLIRNKQISNIKVFTNGLLVDKYIKELRNKKVKICINCNSRNILKTENNYKKLIHNISLLHGLFIDRNKVQLGFNIYSNEMNYEYILNILKQYKKKELRISITVPNNKKEKETDFYQRVMEYKPFLLKFYEDLSKINVLPHYDCNGIPLCFFEKDEQEHLKDLFKDFEHNPLKTRLLSNNTNCTPVVDILPNLQAIRCFGLSDISKVNISDFRNMQEIRDYYIKNIDKKAYTIENEEFCKNCMEYKNKKCSICLVHKEHKIKEIK